MSARLLGLAFDVEAPSASAKLVLIKLVDCCDDEGRKIFPAVATLARAAQCDARTVQRHIAQFCTVGLLRRVREGGKGPGNTSHYEMNLEILRLIAAKGWAAVSGVSVTAETEEEARCPASGHAENAEANPEKGGMVSPFGKTGRATNPDDKDDTGVTQPLKRIPQEFEREGAGAKAKAKAGAGAEAPGHAETGEAAGEADAGDVPQLDAFVALWPTRAVDDQTRVASAWGDLTLTERRAAMGGVRPFLAELDRTKRKHCPAGWKYLSEKRWTLLDDMKRTSDSTETVAVKPFTKPWWALFHRARAGGGGNARLLLQMADQGRAWAVRQGDLAAARPEALSACPAHGEAAQAFLASARRAGFHFPKFREEAWVFLGDADLRMRGADQLNRAGGL